ncbi:MAG: ATP-binding protein [Patescibacteria group bacterium]|nr:ATP-binding protein [Patescibacteria group bacterium]
MAKNILIIVSGLPATGKTTLSQGMAKHLHLPLVSKDTIKEILFDGVGHGDREWGEKLNIPTYNLLNYFVEQELRAGRPLIIETPYDDDFPRRAYEKWQSEYGFECVQVMCYAEPKVLIERFVARIGAPERHPGHNDQAALEDFKRSIKDAEKVKPLSLQGEVYELNTTDFSKIDTESLLKKLEAAMVAPIRDQPTRLNLRLLAGLWFRQKQ